MQCLTRRFALVIVVGSLITYQARGADIIWFSDSDIEADAGFVDLLVGAGHNVARVAEEDPLTATTIDTLNMSDLVITSRSVNSGAFDGDPDMINWNEEVTVPMLAMSAYITRNSRLGWTEGSDLPDLRTPSPLVATDPGHPVFTGIEFEGDGVTMANPYNVVVDRGISTPTTPPVSGGSVIAESPTFVDDTTGEVTGIAIAEWPAGTTVVDDTPIQAVLSAPRYFFAGGSRENDGAGVATAGKLDLTADGRRLFLNTVDYILGDDPPVPGNFDGDADVDADDFLVLSSNLAGHLDGVVGRLHGDMNLDGKIDLTDFGQFKEEFPGAFAAATGVPEPSTIGLVACALAAMALVPLRKRTTRTLSA